MIPRMEIWGVTGAPAGCSVCLRASRCRRSRSPWSRRPLLPTFRGSLHGWLQPPSDLQGGSGEVAKKGWQLSPLSGAGLEERAPIFSCSRCSSHPSTPGGAVRAASRGCFHLVVGSEGAGSAGSVTRTGWSLSCCA